MFSYWAFGIFLLFVLFLFILYFLYEKYNTNIILDVLNFLSFITYFLNCIYFIYYYVLFLWDWCCVFIFESVRHIPNVKNNSDWIFQLCVNYFICEFFLNVRFFRNMKNMIQLCFAGQCISFYFCLVLFYAWKYRKYDTNILSFESFDPFYHLLFLLYHQGRINARASRGWSPGAYTGKGAHWLQGNYIFLIIIYMGICSSDNSIL